MYHTVINEILVPPSIRAESTLVYSTVGKTTELRCSAIAPFDTQVYWRRLDNSTLSKFATQQRQIHNDVTQTSLYLSDLELRDFGFYVCVAESQAGQNHATIELREHHRSSMSHLLDTNEVTTSRMQILKRNKVSEPSMISVKVNSASATFFVSIFHFSCIIVVFDLT
ncbi:unnamed protein product [Adineta ricciae]|uniref:Ig-like domain-containing protein n=1 Tax=Adineta ricciae TaxID=249248 RepID=A0A815BNC3_ADIRI|nr:unnamed protein product [Adineta ricciae]CAF1269771.1 unnamed protein product [Adineta ricciae]